MKCRSASSARQFRMLNQTLMLDQVAELRRTRRVKEGTGSFASVSAAFGPVGPIHPGNPGLIVRTVMPHVFISYVRENGDLVDRLASELKSRGVTVWLDRNDIEPGARWRDAIKKAIRDGKFFLACFSREFNQRDRSYMNEELTFAIDELRERPSSRTWFVPILINETAIPLRRISSVEELSDIHAL